MKTPPVALALLATFAATGCGKKPAPKSTVPPASATERAALSGSSSAQAIGGAPKATIDRAKATLDAAQARETQATNEALSADAP